MVKQLEKEKKMQSASVQRWLRSRSNKGPGGEIKCVPTWRRSHCLLEGTCLSALLESIQAAAQRSVRVQQLFLGHRLSGNNFTLVLRDGTRKPLFISGRCSQSEIEETKRDKLQFWLRVSGVHRRTISPCALPLPRREMLYKGTTLTYLPPAARSVKWMKVL